LLDYSSINKPAGHAVFCKAKKCLSPWKVSQNFCCQNWYIFIQKLATKSRWLAKWVQAFLLRKTASPAGYL